jgi:hypothetical protein
MRRRSGALRGGTGRGCAGRILMVAHKPVPKKR